MMKRWIDVLAAAIGLFLLAPLLLLLVWQIRRKLGSPVFFGGRKAVGWLKSGSMWIKSIQCFCGYWVLLNRTKAGGHDSCCVVYGDA